MSRPDHNIAVQKSLQDLCDARDLAIEGSAIPEAQRTGIKALATSAE
ncbi:hypothetical protein [Candidatus Vondammii sp. HM_W22]|nr:hypothetical protein [Candidatus Vondammii sp. HM_W22]